MISTYSVSDSECLWCGSWARGLRVEGDNGLSVEADRGGGTEGGHGEGLEEKGQRRKGKAEEAAFVGPALDCQHNVDSR